MNAIVIQVGEVLNVTITWEIVTGAAKAAWDLTIMIVSDALKMHREIRMAYAYATQVGEVPAVPSIQEIVSRLVMEEQMEGNAQDRQHQIVLPDRPMRCVISLVDEFELTDGVLMTVHLTEENVTQFARACVMDLQTMIELTVWA